jgi:2-haloacid dehalogenase
MLFEWIIFDADGTLFDYDAAESYAIEATFKYFNLSYENAYLENYRRINHLLWLDFEKGNITIPQLKVRRFQLFLNELNLQDDPELFSDQYLNQLSLRHDLIEGADTLLQMLEEKASLLLMTNGIKEVQRSRLQLSAISHYFSDIIISDEVGVAKPDREIFNIAYLRMSAPQKNRVLMIGDNLSSDIKGACDFGFRTCWFNPQKKPADPGIKADFEISRLDQIRGLLMEV